MVDSLTIEERERLIGACKTHREKLCVNILLETGLRVSEFANLTPDSIQENRIMIYKKAGPHTRNLKKRIVPLTDRCRKLLETHFSLGDGMGITTRTIQRIVAKVASNAAIAKRVTPQILRKNFMTKCLRRGISIQTIQKILDRQLIMMDFYPDPEGEEALKEFF